MALAHDARERLRIGGGFLERVPREHEESGVVAEPARVAHEVVDRDRRVPGAGDTIVRQFGDVFPDVIGVREFVLSDEQRDARGGELFGGGSDVEERRRRDGDIALEIGPAVASAVGESAVAHDAQGATGDVGFVVVLEHGIDARAVGGAHESCSVRCRGLCAERCGNDEGEGERAGCTGQGHAVGFGGRA